MTSHAKQLTRLIAVDFFGSVLWFPVWWYTKGLKRLALRFWNGLQYRISSYGLRVWIKNLFVPMYGQHDIQGKIVSFFMRVVVLIGRSIALAVEAVVYAFGLVIWTVAPAAFLLLCITSAVQGLFFQQVGNLIR
ncbi:hypothetical protein HZC53_06025 [Candidatus Uhrbacteria bacterium]|nr:hypothetical protein [Candidatus Uhrbacteria bacterium]